MYILVKLKVIIDRFERPYTVCITTVLFKFVCLIFVWFIWHCNNLLFYEGILTSGMASIQNQYRFSLLASYNERSVLNCASWVQLLNTVNNVTLTRLWYRYRYIVSDWIVFSIWKVVWLCSLGNRNFIVTYDYWKKPNVYILKLVD